MFISNSEPIINLLIAGIGRQGISTLAGVLARTCRDAGRSCQYTVHKGGAQSLGSVYAEMRIAAGDLPVLGAGIPAGKLDVLVSMDAREALRHLRLAHSETVCFVEYDPTPFFADRSGAGVRDALMVNPIAQLEKLSIPITRRHYRQQAISSDGTAIMANYYAGMDCLSALGLDNIECYKRLFSVVISAHMKV